MKDVRIDNDSNWQRIHWNSILSAYASAPFFEFIEDNFRHVYSTEYRFLLDLNMDLLKSTLEVLQLDIDPGATGDFMPQSPGKDLSSSIHPKKVFKHEKLSFHPVTYHQVFSDRHGFQPDLSILDLLFNEGPNATTILKRSVSEK